MKLVNLPRQGGKTTAAVNWLKAGYWSGGYYSRILITTNEQQAAAIRRSVNLGEGQVVSASRAKIMFQGYPEFVEFGVDEAHTVLSILLGLPKPLALMTLTAEQTPAGLGWLSKTTNNTVGATYYNVVNPVADSLPVAAETLRAADLIADAIKNLAQVSSFQNIQVVSLLQEIELDILRGDTR